MKRPGWIWLLLAFAAVVLSAGIPYWRLSYDQVNRGQFNLVPGALLLLVLTLVLVLTEAASARKIAATMLACVPVIDAISIVQHTARDPTTHNLWPLELLLATLAGAAIVVPAVMLGLALRWALGRHLR
jgi:hypothetical protein